MEHIKYLKPKEAAEQGEEAQHHFDLITEEGKIASAEIDYLSKPIPLYQLTNLYVEHSHKGKGYASQIMNQVEAWLRSKKKPGVLVDAIDDFDPAKGMYERRGWVEVPHEPGLLVYNWPPDVDLSVMRGYGERYTIRSTFTENR